VRCAEHTVSVPPPLQLLSGDRRAIRKCSAPSRVGCLEQQVCFCKERGIACCVRCCGNGMESIVGIDVSKNEKQAGNNERIPRQRKKSAGGAMNDKCHAKTHPFLSSRSQPGGPSSPARPIARHLRRRGDHTPLSIRPQNECRSAPSAVTPCSSLRQTLQGARHTTRRASRSTFEPDHSRQRRRAARSESRGGGN
jgi:hypothetical protein